MAYFVARGEKADPIVVLFADHLRRKFTLSALDPLVAQLKNPKLDPTHPDKELGLHLKTYARLVDPAAAPALDLIAMASNPLDKLALETLYCDRHGIGVNLENRLRELAGHGGYYLTHVTMYVGWALENGCLDEKPAKALFAELGDKLVALITAENGPTDVAMEAIAMLFYTGQGARVQPEWVAQVKKFQREDGGWTHGPMGPTNDHSSLFGLWVLLEASRPGTPAVPWFKR